jgi:hypothetical protein
MLSRPQGFEIMIVKLYILFGHQQNPNLFTKKSYTRLYIHNHIRKIKNSRLCRILVAHSRFLSFSISSHQRYELV